MFKIYLNRFLKGTFYVIVAVILWLILKEIDLDRFSSSEFENFRTVFKILFYIYMISIAISVFLSEKNPSSIISWLMVFVAFPFWGFLMYLFFGKSFNKSLSAKKKAKFKNQRFKTNVRAQKAFIKSDVEVSEIMKEHKRLVTLLLNNSESLIYNYNESQIFTDGYKLFDCLIQDIMSAKHSINLEYFIIKSDKTGEILKKALIEKARDGVEIRVLYDGVGSFRLNSQYIHELNTHNNIQMKAFSPVIIPAISRELNYRNHRKIAVIDGEIAYIGGMNIGDEYRSLNTRFKYWKDTHIKILGDDLEGNATGHPTKEDFLKSAIEIREEFSFLRHALTELRELLDNPDVPLKEKIKYRSSWEKTWGTLGKYKDSPYSFDLADASKDKINLERSLDGIGLDSIMLTKIVEKAISEASKLFYCRRVRMLHKAAKNYITSSDGHMNHQIRKFYRSETEKTGKIRE